MFSGGAQRVAPTTLFPLGSPGARGSPRQTPGPVPGYGPPRRFGTHGRSHGHRDITTAPSSDDRQGWCPELTPSGFPKIPESHRSDPQFMPLIRRQSTVIVGDGLRHDTVMSGALRPLPGSLTPPITGPRAASRRRVTPTPSAPLTGTTPEPGHHPPRVARRDTEIQRACDTVIASITLSCHSGDHDASGRHCCVRRSIDQAAGNLPVDLVVGTLGLPNAGLGIVWLAFEAVRSAAN